MTAQTQTRQDDGYDPCNDEALRDELSLELVNGSEDFEEYELSAKTIEMVNRRTLATLLGTH